MVVSKIILLVQYSPVQPALHLWQVPFTIWHILSWQFAGHDMLHWFPYTPCLMQPLVKKNIATGKCMTYTFNMLKMQITQKEKDFLLYLAHTCINRFLKNEFYIYIVLESISKYYILLLDSFSSTKAHWVFVIFFSWSIIRRT